jgi:hypothetical protein
VSVFDTPLSTREQDLAKRLHEATDRLVGVTDVLRGVVEHLASNDGEMQALAQRHVRSVKHLAGLLVEDVPDPRGDE